MKKITDKQKLELLNLLEEQGLFFKKFWGISDIFFVDDKVLPTAAVTSHNNRVQFLFNENFWELLTPKARLFVICHEQLHLMNNHFVRLRFQDGNAKLKNVAADVAINEMLIRNYDFEKTDLPDHEKYCWLDTIFGDEEYRYVTDNETAEYYYSILLSRKEKRDEQIKKMIENGELEVVPGDGEGGDPWDTQETLDDHIFSEENQDNLSPEIRDAIEEALEEFEKANPDSNETKQAAKRLAYRKAKKAGIENGTMVKSIDIPVKKKRHWKKLYKTICKSIYDASQAGHWAFIDRKMALLKTGLDLPGDFIKDEVKKTKVLVYLDTSGSCVNDTEFFLQNAMSLPKDLFEVRYFGFDTKIYPINPKPPFQIQGGGGTSFHCIQSHVENEMDYYDAVFVFTDGEAGQAEVERPTRWFWFITPSGTHNAISPGSRSFGLEDYGWNEAKSAYNKRSGG